MSDIPAETEQNELVSISPSTNILSSLRHQDLQWHIILAELIDNAIDAGCTQVTVEFSSNGLAISDDGVGCSDLVRMIAIGYRQDHQFTSSGKYGIGGKEAMLICGNTVEIESTTPDGWTRSVCVDWEAMFKSKSWNIKKPVQVRTGKPQGTTITIGCLKKKLPDDLSGTCNLLGRLYTPALRNGTLSVRLKRKKVYPIQPLPEPAETTIKQTFTFSENKIATISMGIITRPELKKYAGVWLALPKRIVREHTRVGLGERPTPGLWGFVELTGKGWTPSKNKTSISEEDEKLIGRTIANQPEFARLIEESSRTGEDLVIRGIEARLGLAQDLLAESGKRTRKAKRNSPTNHTGPILPIDTGIRHKRASKTQPGDRFAEAKIQDGARIRLQVEACDKKDPLLTMASDHIVRINSAHPYYGFAGGQDNLVPMIIAFLAGQWILQGQQVLPIPDELAGKQEQFSYVLSQMLDKYQEAEVRMRCEAVRA